MSGFKIWFVENYPRYGEYFEDTAFDGEWFNPINEWHPDHCNHAHLLNVSLKIWNHQQARIDELQQENERLKAELVALAGEVG